MLHQVLQALHVFVNSGFALWQGRGKHQKTKAVRLLDRTAGSLSDMQ